MTLTDFNLNEKTEEEKRLLRYSDKPVAAIVAHTRVFPPMGIFLKCSRNMQE